MADGQRGTCSDDTIQVDVAGHSVRLLGSQNPVAAAVVAALKANGAHAAAAGLSDILLVSAPLVPDEKTDLGDPLDEVSYLAAEMQTRGQGRIVFLLSSAAVAPMRRYPRYSRCMAAAAATMRALAMQHGPQVRANAVGLGCIGTPPVSGDPAMLGHASLGRAGEVEEAVAAVLAAYASQQIRELT